MILNTADEIMGALERGNLAKDWAEAIRDVIAGIQEQDEGKGSVTLKLAISVKGDMVSIKAKVDRVIPQRERKSTSFFATGDARLSLQHPDQIDMRFERQGRNARAVDVE